jgi:hypothetical protein
VEQQTQRIMKTIVEINFGAHRIPGGLDAILGPSGCGQDEIKISQYMIGGGVNRMAIDVTMTLEDNDPRIASVLALLAPHGEDTWVWRSDIYTEDDLQAAPLLEVSGWSESSALGGLAMGTTYDRSNACPNCSTGMRQTSPLMIGDDEMRTVDKHRVAGTYRNDVLVRDTDVEKLIAAKVTGAVFWPAYFKEKSGEVTELRWQQAIIESVMPPMAASSSLERKGVCPTCSRGGYTTVFRQPGRLFYRAEDVANAKDFNLSWEWFGDYCKREEPQYDLVPHPLILVTPKVMNLLRGKTKKEQKYQGCDFIPIWIEEEKAS